MKLSSIVVAVSLISATTTCTVDAQLRGASREDEESIRMNASRAVPHRLQRGLMSDQKSSSKETTLFLDVDSRANIISNMVLPGAIRMGMSMTSAGGASLSLNASGGGSSNGNAVGASIGGGAGGNNGSNSGGGGAGCTSERDCGSSGGGGDMDGGTTGSSATDPPVPAPATRATLPPFDPSNDNVCPNFYSATFHSHIVENEETKFCTSNADCVDFFSTALRVACCLYPQCLCGPFLRPGQCVPN